MRYFWIAALLVLGLAAAVGTATYTFMRAGAQHPADEDAMQWLQREFQLSDEKLAAIAAAHDDYRLVCNEHCTAIATAREEVGRLEARGAPSNEIAEARASADHLDAVCRASIVDHVCAIADMIGGEQGRRYLRTVIPLVADFDHGGAPDLKLRSPGSDHAGHTRP